MKKKQPPHPGLWVAGMWGTVPMLHGRLVHVFELANGLPDALVVGF